MHPINPKDTIEIGGSRFHEEPGGDHGGIEKIRRVNETRYSYRVRFEISPRGGATLLPVRNRGSTSAQFTFAWRGVPRRDICLHARRARPTTVSDRRRTFLFLLGEACVEEGHTGTGPGLSSRTPTDNMNYRAWTQSSRTSTPSAWLKATTEIRQVNTPTYQHQYACYPWLSKGDPISGGGIGR
jgi:hypothetical protein